MTDEELRQKLIDYLEDEEKQQQVKKKTLSLKKRQKAVKESMNPNEKWTDNDD